MTGLYENRQRAKRARFSIVAAFVWSVGCLYWAYALKSGGSRPGVIAIVALVGILPLVALHFYSGVYVIRVVRDGGDVVVTTLGLFGSRDVRVPVHAITEVARPEAGAMTMRVAGRGMPFMLDLQAEHADLDAISALVNHDATDKP